MKKATKIINNKKYYLIGKNNDNEKVWLCEASFDCGWYWGFGYIATFNNRNNQTFHGHFSRIKCVDAFKKYFSDTVLTNAEMWILLELMNSFYNIREYANILYTGGANYTKNPCKTLIKNDVEYNRINKEVLPELFKEVYKILSI